MRKNRDLSRGKERGVGRRELLWAIAGAGVATTGAFTPSSITHAEVWEEGDEQCRVQQVPPSSPPDLTELQLKQFTSVSETLTGAGKRPSQSPLVLQPRLAAQYLERFAQRPDYFPKLLRLFEVHEAYAAAAGAPPDPDKIAERIMNNQETDADDIRAAAEQVIYLWYVSAFFLPPLKEDPLHPGQPAPTGPPIWIYGSTEQYEQGLLWKVVKAHAPMMPGGKPKYWAGPAI